MLGVPSPEPDLESSLARVKGAVRFLAPELDVEPIYVELARGLVSRRELYTEHPYLPSYEVQSLDEELSPEQLSQALAYHFSRLQELDISVSPCVIPSRVPLLGGVIDFVKEKFHELALYYVSILASKQAAYNAQTLRVIQLLKKQVQQLETELREQGASRHTPGGKDG